MKDQRKTKTQLIAELEALRQSEEQYRQIFESANDAIISLTLDGIITTTNRGAEVLLGWPREERVGRHYREFLTLPSVTFTQERARRIQAGEKVSSIYEIELLRKDGSVVPVEARSRFIRDREGKPIGILAIHRDITARKQAEAALRESEQRYRAVSELISDYAYAARIEPDDRYTVEWFTETFTRVTGFTFGKEPYSASTWRIVHPDDVPIVRERRQKLLAGQSDVSEFRIVRKDGEVRWIREYGRPVWDEGQGRVARLYFAGHDITDRRRTEEALRESENDVAPENILPYSLSPARRDSGDEKGAPSDTTHFGY